MCPTGVESGETSLLNAAHTAGDTSQSTLRYFCRERSFCFSIGSFSSDGWREAPRKEKNNMNSEEQEKYLRSCQPGEDSAQNNLHKSQTTQRLPAAGEPRRLQQLGRGEGERGEGKGRGERGEGKYSTEQWLLRKKEAARIEFVKFPNSNSFITWKMNIR